MLSLKALAASLSSTLSARPRASLAAWYPTLASKIGTAAAAAAAGAAAAVGAAPPPASGGVPRMHTNIGSILVSMVRNEGAAALMRGLLPRIVVSGPASAATFVLYEQVLKLSTKPVGGGEEGMGSSYGDGEGVAGRAGGAGMVPMR